MFNILRQFHTNGYPLSFEFALLEPGQGSQTLVETSYLASELFLELRAEMTSKSLMAELSKHGREEITSIDEYLVLNNLGDVRVPGQKGVDDDAQQPKRARG